MSQEGHLGSLRQLAIHARNLRYHRILPCPSPLAKIARIDRLPPDNTLGGLNAIQFAWDVVDICNYVADFMKKTTKASFVTLLALGLTIGSLTVVQLNEPGLIDIEDLNLMTASLALASGFIAGLTSIFDPWQKWTRLRGAALAIESEIWRFRTRTGVYTEDGGDMVETPELILKTRVESIYQQVKTCLVSLTQ